MTFSDLFVTDSLTVLPELFLLTVSLALLVVGAVGSTSQSLQYPLLLPSLTWIGSVALAVTALLVLWSPGVDSIVLYGFLVNDDASVFFRLLLLGSAFCVLLLSQSYFSQENINAFEPLVLMLLAVSAMMLMVSSLDLLGLYLALEFQSLCLYVLAATKRDSEFATEAGLKYFFLGALASGILLLGCSLVYGYTGTTNLEDCARLFAGCEEVVPPTVRLGLLCIGIAFLFKASAAPFHMWAPDVYEGAPTPMTAFMATGPKVAVFALFARVYAYGFFDLLDVWQQLFLLCSVLSLVVGSFWALAQYKMKRLLAFSSIGHVGFLLLGIATGTLEGLEAVLLYLVLYLAMTLTVFGTLLALQAPGARGRYIGDCAMLGRTNPLLHGPTSSDCAKYPPG